MTPKKIYIEADSFKDEYSSTVAWNYCNDAELKEYISADALKELVKVEVERRFKEYNRDDSHHLQAAECADLLCLIDALIEE